MQSYDRVVDVPSKGRHQWEIDQLNETIDFDCADIKIDPAPFQLVDKTSISKVHGLFTILGIRRAYVTRFGKLVGVVGLKELVTAIENVNSGNFSIQFTDIALLPQSDLDLGLNNSKSGCNWNTHTSTNSALLISDVVLEMEKNEIGGPRCD